MEASAYDKEVFFRPAALEPLIFNPRKTAFSATTKAEFRGKGVTTTESTKIAANTTIGLIGAAMAALLGGWDAALQTLVGFMAADYFSGLIVAGVFKRSTKTVGGALSSAAGLRGLFKKGGMLLVVYVACRLDLLVGADYIRDTVVIALITNETVSITENVGLMGVPIPKIIKRAIEILKNKEDNEK